MKKLALFVTVVFCIKVTFAQFNYPVTRLVDSSSTYWSKTYKDPYRWLEDIKNPEVEQWFKNQANLTNKVLNNLNGRDELIAEYRKLNKLQPAQYRKQCMEGGRVFYCKTMPGEKVAKLYYRNGMAGKEILLFNPSTFIKDKELSILSIAPSYDGKKILINYSAGGAEISTIKVLDVDSKHFLSETIYPSWSECCTWTPDNKAFIYTILKSGDNTSMDMVNNAQTRLHVLGTDIKLDKLFFGNESYPGLNIPPNEIPNVVILKDASKYIFADLQNVHNEMFTYYAKMDELHNNTINWKLLCRKEDGIVRGREIIGNDVYAITNKNAPNYKLIHTSLLNPDWSDADEVVSEKPNQTLENVIHCKDYLLMTYSDGINFQLYKYNLKTKKISQIKLPFVGAVFARSFNTQTNICYVYLTSWSKPNTEYLFDASTNTFSPSNFTSPPHYPKEYTDVITEEVSVKGHDGVMIPLSIMYKKGLKKDGSNVCLMEGYGAYGISITSSFWEIQMALAVKGAVVAIAHIRGGSEKGEAWYKGGFKNTKPNTWKDFISCAGYLIANGYTSAKHLAGTGTSAGGILISRAITERPDLFAAAICNVGIANVSRFEFTPNGPTNIPEFGTVTDSAECKGLFEMDGVQHVVNGTVYPALICVAGWNDPRVIPWQPGKFAAALQNATTSNKPVFLKINYDNGHFTEDKEVTFSNFANQYAFAMWQCGHPDFQPKK